MAYFEASDPLVLALRPEMGAEVVRTFVQGHPVLSGALRHQFVVLCAVGLAGFVIREAAYARLMRDTFFRRHQLPAVFVRFTGPPRSPRSAGAGTAQQKQD